MQVARDPMALLHRLLPLAALGPGQLPGCPLALADHGGEEQRRHRGHDDVDLCAQGPVVDGLLEERPDVVGGDADRHTGRDRDRQGRAGRAEPGRRPDQRGEHHVGDGLAGGHGQCTEGRHGGDQQDALGAAQPPPRAAGIAGPCEHQWHHDQCAGDVAEPPRPPERGRLIRGDDSTGQHRHQPHGRADRRSDGEGREQPTDLLRAIDGRARADEPPQQQGAHDHLGHVARLLTQQAPERQRVRLGEQLRVDHELGDEDTRPPAHAPEIERGDTQAGRWPDGRDRGRVVQRLADLGRAVVSGREEEDARQIPADLRAPARPPSTERRLNGRELGWGAHGRPPGRRRDVAVLPCDRSVRQMTRRPPATDVSLPWTMRPMRAAVRRGIMAVYARRHRLGR